MNIVYTFYCVLVTPSDVTRIVFSFTPNSAGAERVFSLLKLFFGPVRDSSLADVIQASLMLRYNERKVGYVQA